LVSYHIASPGRSRCLTEEVALLDVERVIEKLSNVLAHSGDCDLGHLDSLPVEYLEF
jgi:hypothetical protein